MSMSKGGVISNAAKQDTNSFRKDNKGPSGSISNDPKRNSGNFPSPSKHPQTQGNSGRDQHQQQQRQEEQNQPQTQAQNQHRENERGRGNRQNEGHNRDRSGSNRPFDRNIKQEKDTKPADDKVDKDDKDNKDRVHPADSGATTEAAHSGEKKFTGRCRLFVGNLTPDTTEDEFRKMFEAYGEVAEVYVNSGRGFGFIRLDYRQNAEAAKAALDGQTRKGRVLRVRFATHGAALKVKNLHPYVSNELLEQSFSQFGELERCVVIVDDRGKSLGEGIVEFARKPGANSALRRITEGVFLMGAEPKPITVEPLEHKDEEDGLPEKLLTKTEQYKKEREKEPRFAPPGTFEYEFGMRFKQLEDLEKQNIERVKKDTEEGRLKLEDEMQNALYEFQADQIRQELARQQEELRRLEELRNQDMMRRQQEYEKRHQQEERERAQQEERRRADAMMLLRQQDLGRRGPLDMPGMQGRDDLMLVDRFGDRMSDRMSDRMPDRMSDRMQDRMSDRMQDRMGDRMVLSDRMDRMNPGQPGLMWEDKAREAALRGDVGRNRGPGGPPIQPPPIPPPSAGALERGGPAAAVAANAEAAAQGRQSSPKPLQPPGAGFGSVGSTASSGGGQGLNTSNSSDNNAMDQDSIEFDSSLMGHGNEEAGTQEPVSADDNSEEDCPATFRSPDRIISASDQKDTAFKEMSVEDDKFNNCIKDVTNMKFTSSPVEANHKQRHSPSNCSDDQQLSSTDGTRLQDDHVFTFNVGGNGPSLPKCQCVSSSLPCENTEDDKSYDSDAQLARKRVESVSQSHCSSCGGSVSVDHLSSGSRSSEDYVESGCDISNISLVVDEKVQFDSRITHSDHSDNAIKNQSLILSRSNSVPRTSPASIVDIGNDLVSENDSVLNSCLERYESSDNLWSQSESEDSHSLLTSQVLQKTECPGLWQSTLVSNIEPSKSEQSNYFTDDTSTKINGSCNTFISCQDRQSSLVEDYKQPAKAMDDFNQELVSDSSYEQLVDESGVCDYEPGVRADMYSYKQHVSADGEDMDTEAVHDVDDVDVSVNSDMYQSYTDESVLQYKTTDSGIEVPLADSSSISDSLEDNSLALVPVSSADPTASTSSPSPSPSPSQPSLQPSGGGSSQPYMSARQPTTVHFMPAGGSIPFVPGMNPSMYAGPAVMQGVTGPTVLTSSSVHIAQHPGGATIMQHQSMRTNLNGMAQATVMQQQKMANGMQATSVLQRTMTNGGQTMLVQQRTMTTGLDGMTQQTVVQQQMATPAMAQAAMYHANAMRHRNLATQQANLMQQRAVRLVQAGVVGSPVVHTRSLGRATLVPGGASAMVGPGLFRGVNQGTMMQHLVRQRYLGGPVMPGRGIQLVAGRPIRVKMTYPRESMPMDM